MTEPVVGARVGYARVSTTQQSLDQQTDVLTLAGVTRIFSDVRSGARDDRAELAAMLDYVRPGDTVVVAALDRLGRTVTGIFRTVDTLRVKGCHVQTLREGIDTSTPIGRLFMAFFAGIAEYERTLIMERSAVARQAARDRGKLPGAPRKLSPDDLRHLASLRASGESVAELCRRFDVSRATLYRAMKELPDIA